MDSPHHTPETPSTGSGESMTLAAFLAELLNTRECRGVLIDLVLDTLSVWGQQGPKKKSLVKPLTWLIQKNLSREPDSDSPTLSDVFAKPAVIEGLLKQTPELSRLALDLIHGLVLSLEDVPGPKKERLLGEILSSVDGEKAGDIISSLARTLQSIHKESPTFFSDRLLPQLDGLIGRTDFGEISDTLSAGKGDVQHLIHGALDLIFSYPAKMISLLSFVPGGVNLLFFVLKDLFAHINTLPPDVLTDFMLVLFKRIDEKQIGQMINTASEMIRQIHTGSALIGEAGSPQFSMELGEKTRNLAQELDPVLLLKARKALIEGKDVLTGTLTRAALENPDLLKLHLEQLALKRNSSIRALKQKIEVIEDLPEVEAEEAITVGLSSWNAFDLAEVVNATCRMVNRVHDFKPEFLTTLVSEFVRSLDLFELTDFLAWFAKDMGETVRPVVRTVAPHIIREVFSALSPEDDGNDEAIDEARNLMRRFIMNGEERP